mgnify:CR=1 FL=1
MYILIIVLALLPLSAFAEQSVEKSVQQNTQSEKQAREVPDKSLTSVKPTDYHRAAPPPPGQEIRKYARDKKGRTVGNFGTIPVHDNMFFSTIGADRFEQRIDNNGDNAALWDIYSWIGGDYNKIYFETEGEQNTSSGELESAELELFYSRNVATFWDLRAGLRYDILEGTDDRNFVAFGAQGLAPYWFEIDATAYISDEGDVSATFEAEYDLLLSQRLVLQPRLEMSLALQDVPEYNIGTGIDVLELGVRLRYEISRKFAPYIGIEWEGNFGETQDLRAAAGEDARKTVGVAGIKFWL